MHFLEFVNQYNESNIELKELINLLAEELDESISSGVLLLFSKDILNKNKVVKPIYMTFANDSYKFYCGENELFKITKKEYNYLDTSKSALRCSFIPSFLDSYVISNDQFEVGTYGLYENYSEGEPYTNYRYISIKSSGDIDYEAFINKNKCTMQKNYYAKDYKQTGVVERYFYSINFRENNFDDCN